MSMHQCRRSRKCSLPVGQVVRRHRPNEAGRHRGMCEICDSASLRRGLPGVAAATGMGAASLSFSGITSTVGELSRGRLVRLRSRRKYQLHQRGAYSTVYSLHPLDSVSGVARGAKGQLGFAQAM